MKTILAPVDFSPITESVVAAAVTLAQAVDARVVVLHTTRLQTAQIAMVEYSVAAERLERLEEKRAAEELARVAKQIQKGGIASAIVQTAGSPVADILAQAEKVSADYIVMGSHGHTALYDLLVGSTASGVLKHASCPVVIVPPRHRSSACVPATTAEALVS